MQSHAVYGVLCSHCKRAFTGTSGSQVYKQCLGHTHKSRGCRNAEILRFSVSLGGYENMVGGAGGPARPRHDTEP